jgi:hypothetical protein
VRGPLEQRRARQFERAVEIGDGAEVGVVPDVTDATVAAGVLKADLRGAVGRRVVADDDLEVAEGLRQEMVYRLRQKIRIANVRFQRCLRYGA